MRKIIFVFQSFFKRLKNFKKNKRLFQTFFKKYPCIYGNKVPFFKWKNKF